MLLAALAFAAAMTLVTPARRDLVVGDETKYGQVVREMRATSSWFLPTLNGEPFTHKPPLHFWAVGVLTFVFGLYSTWSFVIPSLAGLAFLLWLMWRMGGAAAAFITGTSLMIWVSAQTARMDVSFTAFLTLAIWMLQRFLDSEDRRALLLAGVCTGIATLIKGPMAPVIVIVLFLFEWWRRKRVPRVNYFPALAAMALIPLAWFVPAMILGGSSYTNDIVMKQTVGRAVASWVHRAPPWYYLTHMPGILFPWFLAALVALRGANRFYLSWIAAVLVPYSLMSSKLDIYMMTLIPAVALLIADRIDDKRVRIANIMTLVPLAIVGLGIRFIVPYVKGEGTELLALPRVQGLFYVLGAAALVGILASRRFSFVALGLTPILALAYAGLFLAPLINDYATTRPLIAALEKQDVLPEQIALYSTPYLWSRLMPPELERVRYVDPQNIGQPAVIVTSRRHAEDIAPALRGYRRVDQLRMIGKWFDVYRR